MPSISIDGIATRYEILGCGPPLLMYAPGGFNAVIEAWSTLGVYAKIRLLDHLPQKFTCIAFDRRECGQSGGRVEPITWAHYVAQGKGLLDYLGIARAHLAGGCMGCPPVAAFAVAHPRMVASMILYWPVGGAKYRQSSHRRFAEHLAFVQSEGLAAVVALVRRDGKPFGADPRAGPWASVIRRDAEFAAAYAAQDMQAYVRICENMRDALFDRDTAPGAEPADLKRTEIPALIVPGNDDSHATSAAQYLDACLPLSEYWDMPVEGQTEAATNARILEFLAKITGEAASAE
jgi:pimeloyl-ACP methyl ester carboxylesterase